VRSHADDSEACDDSQRVTEMEPKVTTKEYGNVKEMAERLGCNVPTSMAFLPRNFDQATSKDELVHWSSVQTLRKLFLEKGITETKFEQDGDKFKYLQQNAYLEAVAIFVAAAATSGNQELIAVALNMVATYLTDSFKHIGKLMPEQQIVKFNMVVGIEEGKRYMRFEYDGPAPGLERHMGQAISEFFKQD